MKNEAETENIIGLRFARYCFLGHIFLESIFLTNTGRDAPLSYNFFLSVFLSVLPFRTTRSNYDTVT